MLAQEIEEEQKRELFQDYIGQALWHITTIQHFKTTQENSMPQYIEIAHPDMMPKQQSAEEIKKHILDRLKE